MFDGPADRAERLTRMRYQELTFVLGAATASDNVAILEYALTANRISCLIQRNHYLIRAYIRNQELADRQLEQFELKISAAQNPNNRPNIP
jgi:hypothetical protein